MHVVKCNREGIAIERYAYHEKDDSYRSLMRWYSGKPEKKEKRRSLWRRFWDYPIGGYPRPTPRQLNKERKKELRADIERSERIRKEALTPAQREKEFEIISITGAIIGSVSCSVILILYLLA